MKMRLLLTLAVLATGEKSASMGFTQQVIIVVLTAALSTFLISLIFRWIDQPREEWQSKREHQRNLEQKRVEADLARQSKRLDSTFCKSRSRSFRRQIPSKHRRGDTKKTLSSFPVR